MAFKKSNSSAGEEFAARKRPPLRSNDQIDVNDIETLKYYITDYGKILPARITGVTSAQQRQIRRVSSAPVTWASWLNLKGAIPCRLKSCSWTT